MKIDRKLEEYIHSLGDMMENNITSAEFFNEHFFNWMPTTDVSYFESFVGEELIKELLLDLDGLSEDDIEEEFLNTYLIPAVKEVKKEDFENNLYVKTIKIPNAKKGKYVLGNLNYHPYELFPLDDVKVDEKSFMELSQIGYFKESFSYPYLGTSDSVWMSLNPNEIMTMDKHIKKAKGNVLVLGLGMGYFAFMVANKKEVNNVIVVEKDQNIIDLFMEHIYPSFLNKDKIRIVKEDAFKYLDNKENNKKFDMVFIDLWHSVEDGINIFLRLKEVEGRINKPFMYWIDTSLYAMVRRSIVTILIEHLENEHPRYDIARDEIDKAINNIYKKIKDLDIDSEEQIHELLSDKSIDELLKK